MPDRLQERFSAVWLVDFEFSAPPGERPVPLCLLARELISGRLLRVWIDANNELMGADGLPIDAGPQTLFVAFNASEKLGCYLALNWPLPERILDLYVEFRNLTNGKETHCGNGLMGARASFGLPAMAAATDSSMRELAKRGGPYSEFEQLALLDYSQSHVDATAGLLRKMLPAMDLSRALLRGRYMAAVARVERNGIPIDMLTLSLLRKHWDAIKTKLIGRVDADYGVYENGSFRVDRWAKYLVEKGIRWPHLPSGELALDGDTFSKMAKLYPEQVGPIRELRHAMGQLRLNDLAVGSDGRNRCSLSAFRSKTGRNQPSTSRFIFGPACWMRSLIKPEPGRAVAYVDWSQQEFGIAAALSKDAAMMEAYTSGDPYLTFAKQAGAVPQDATKKSHPTERGQFKVCALAVQYGMGEKSLGQTLGESPAVARELLQLHHQTYPNFWLWSEAAVDHAMLHGCLQTVFDWRIHAGSDANPRSLANFPCQANGAEMLRLACCLATERGINVCAPVHDAVLIEASIEDIDEVVRKTQEAMREASEVILRGFSLRTEADIVRWPHRYVDERGVSMWRTVTSILSEMESSSPLKTAAYPGTQPPTSPATICCPGQSYIKSIRE